jgi:hypothetical protein
MEQSLLVYQQNACSSKANDAKLRNAAAATLIPRGESGERAATAL